MVDDDREYYALGRLWHKILCFFGIHHFGGLLYSDFLNEISVQRMQTGSFYELMRPPGSRHWYRLWLQRCWWCKKLHPVTEQDVPIEMRSIN